MVGVIEYIGSQIAELYGLFLSTLPAWAQNFVNLFLLIILIFLYSLFIWKLYRFVARKNIIGLDLNQYNRSEHPFVTKLLAGTFYITEYIIIMPFIIFFWFAIFTIFIILMSEGIPVATTLIISAVIVGSIRVASYYNEDLSKDLAKLLPFTLLAVSITTSGFFNFERIISQLSGISSHFGNIAQYLIFIVLLELVLRSFDLLFNIFGIEDINVDNLPQEDAKERN